MISNKMKSLIKGSSMIRAMFEEGKLLSEKIGKDNVFDFSLGNPNVPAPKEFNEALKTLLSTKDPLLLHGYMDNAGHTEVRSKIASHLNAQYRTTYTETNLIMTIGAAGGLNVIFKSLLNPNDEVLTFSPFFSEYRHYVENYSGTLIPLPPNEENDFRPDSKELEKHISPKTKALIINNPNNPTGIVYTEAELKSIALVLEKKSMEYGTSIYLISDEPYRELVYDGKKVPFLPSIYKNTVLCYSYSKSLALAGERIGYLLIPDSVSNSSDLILAAKTATRILGFVNAPSMIQLAIGECLTLHSDFSIYEENRNLLYSFLSDLGFYCIKPEGAFYLLMKTPVEDSAFSRQAKEYNLLLVPTSAFGAKNYVRIAYCVNTNTVKKSLPSFQKLAEYYQIQK